MLSQTPTPYSTRQPVMNKVLALFNKTHDSDNPPYPKALERHYRISKKVLGVGTFAVVKECTDRYKGGQYALKIILKKAIAGKENMLNTELDVLKKVFHPNIVSMHDLFESQDAVYIITDLASGGELFTQLLAKGSYTEVDASLLIKQVLQGVDYLHDRDIVHRDLKPENLLFKDKTEHSPLMITDFGLSKILENHNEVLLTACGTPGYVAPEVLKQTGHGKPVDMWSIGVITYTLLCGYTPFYGSDQAALFDSIMLGKYEFDIDYWSDISNSAKNFVSRLLTYEPEKRITAKEALKHPWIAGGEFSDSAASSPNGIVDLLANAKKNGFSGRQTFRKAVTALTAVQRMRASAPPAGGRGYNGLPEDKDGINGTYKEDDHAGLQTNEVNETGGEKVEYVHQPKP